MISEIKAALSELDERVLCGVARTDDNNSWDCLVVQKERIRADKATRSYVVSVRIIREDEVPEGMEDQVITCMRSIGWKPSAEDITYEYVVDANEVVVEICKIDFYKLVKGCVKS